MNIKHLFLGLVAAAAVLVGCQPKEIDYGVAKISVSTASLSFGASSSSQTLQVTATREWTVSGVPDWIAVDPAGGQPSLDPQNVTVTVISNDGYNREADIAFTIGLMKEYVKVSQAGQKGEFETGDGTKEKPYSASAAIDYVSSLPADTETGPVYLKGIVSSVVTTYEASGNYGNATFYISDDGSTTAPQFYVYQTLYLGNKKWTSGKPDIKVGDEVIICGKLMNYRGNTPETVSGKAYLYALNGGDTPGGGGGGDTPGGGSVSFATNSGAQTWAAETDGTYGAGFGTTAEGLKLGYYKHTGSTAAVAPNANHVRIYKNSVLSVASTEGKKIKKIVLNCAPNAGTTSYCFDMTGLEGGASATCDKTALTVTWTGSAAKVVLHAVNGQVRMEKITVEFE